MGVANARTVSLMVILSRRSSLDEGKSPAMPLEPVSCASGLSCGPLLGCINGMVPMAVGLGEAVNKSASWPRSDRWADLCHLRHAFLCALRFSMIMDAAGGDRRSRDAFRGIA